MYRGIILLLLILSSFGFVSGNFAYNYLETTTTSTSSVNLSNSTINNSLCWLGHCTTDGSWLTNLNTYNATYDMWAYNQTYAPIDPLWLRNGNDIFNNNSGRVGIGTTIPRGNLDINGTTQSIFLGTGTESPIATPSYIEFSNEYSSVAGKGLKIRLYNASSSTYGFGVSSNSIDYVTPAGATSHNFYNGAVVEMEVSGTNVEIKNNNFYVLGATSISGFYGTTGFYGNVTMTKKLSVNNTAIFNEDVGIGTTIPRGNLDINGTTKSIFLGTGTTVSTATPSYMEFSNEYSSVAGKGLKIRLYNASSSTYGFGVSTGSLDYVTPAGATSHNFYNGAVVEMEVSGTNVQIPNNNFYVLGATSISGFYGRTSFFGNVTMTKKLSVNNTAIFNEDVTIITDLNVTKNVIITGNATYNSYYAGMWFHNDTGFPVSLNDTYLIMNFTTSTYANGFIFEKNSVLRLITDGGVYQIIYNIGGSGVNNHEYHTCVFINGLCDQSTNAHAIGQASNFVNMNGVGFARINAGDNVTVRIKDVGTTSSGTAYIGNVNIVRVGN